MLQIKYFRAYSEEAVKLEYYLKKNIVIFLKNELDIDASFEVYDSKGLSNEEGNAPWNVLSFALNNAIVIIDGSLETSEDVELGANYDCITAAVSSLDNILVISRTQLPLNFIPCRSNVPLLGEQDEYQRNNRGGYIKSYDNDEIIVWLEKELKKMYYNVNTDNPSTNRLIRPKNLIIDLKNTSFLDLLQRENAVMKENLAAKKREGGNKKKIFISYRTKYYTDGNNPNASKYCGKFNIIDVANRVIKYHEEIGDAVDWDAPFYYPAGVLSNEFMPENRRWAFVSIPDRKIRECDEFWIFNTQHKSDTEGEVVEVGYWDSWWCLGEFLTLIRMKYAGESKAQFKIMLFNPDNENPIEELKWDQIPRMSHAQNRELARYYANGDFLEAGLETMGNMRKKRSWSKARRYLYFLFMKNSVWSKIIKGFGATQNIPFEHYNESIESHVYDHSFISSRIIECDKCKHIGLTMEEVLSDSNFVWNFLNINKCYFSKITGLRRQDGIIRVEESELSNFIQNDGSYLVPCKNHHTIKVRKSSDKFYIFWQPENGKYTGPLNSAIEVVDLYEII
jgi:hypothetical protein